MKHLHLTKTIIFSKKSHQSTSCEKRNTIYIVLDASNNEIFGDKNTYFKISFVPLKHIIKKITP